VSGFTFQGKAFFYFTLNEDSSSFESKHKSQKVYKAPLPPNYLTRMSTEKIHQSFKNHVVKLLF
jgi:hypothetical protein